MLHPPYLVVAIVHTQSRHVWYNLCGTEHAAPVAACHMFIENVWCPCDLSYTCLFNVWHSIVLEALSQSLSGAMIVVFSCGCTNTENVFLS